MKLNIYSIFDTASGLYSRPFFTQADAEAMRSFSDIVQDAEHPVGKHPEDYAVYRIGIFDDTKGNMINEENECLSTGLEATAQSRNVKRDNLDQFDKAVVLEDKDQNYGGTQL